MTPNFKIKNVLPLQSDLCTLTTQLTVNVTFDRSITKTTGAATLTGHVIQYPTRKGSGKGQTRRKANVGNDSS